MKFPLRLCSVAFCFAAAAAFAGSDSKNVVTESPKNSGPIVEINPRPKLSFEFEVSDAYLGDADIGRGGYEVDDFDENDFLARLVFTPRVKFGILRLGAAYERYDFGIDADNQIRNGIAGGRLERIIDETGNETLFVRPLSAELPGRLEAANFVVGLDTEFTDSFLIRIEAHPGWYGAGGDLFDGDNFRVPFIAGGTWVYSSTLQFTLGVGVDFEGKFPVLPGGGVRWQFAPDWVLNAVMPTPRLEYSPTKALTIYAGAEIKSETFRTTEQFGDLAGDPRLNNAHLTYSEVRTGLGVDWHFASNAFFTVEGGYVPFRQFDYTHVHVRYHEDGGAPYGSVGLNIAF